ncbi:hypothetical protein CRG98_030626 [Punica granatum]|uniref:Uncharacterized protein n=1 Tax=Punica granatum TaxID=22663 RepID=A0A2I0IYF6_PUNGR|nr:hypothetical protein CRG98_030626 [Punica granatum]
MVSGDSFSRVSVTSPTEGGHSQAARSKSARCGPRRESTFGSVQRVSHLYMTRWSHGPELVIVADQGLLDDGYMQGDRLVTQGSEPIARDSFTPTAVAAAFPRAPRAKAITAPFLLKLLVPCYCASLLAAAALYHSFCVTHCHDDIPQAPCCRAATSLELPKLLSMLYFCCPSSP